MKNPMTKFLAALSLSAAMISAAPAALASGDEVHLAEQEWSFDGLFGQLDKAAVRRGYQVYSEVCSGCHSLNLLAYRNLSDKGGPEFSVDEVKEIAKSHEVPAGPNEDGETTDEDGYPLMRPATPADRFVAPFANENAAKAANGGALPPDLSLVAKSRAGGPDYLYNLLTGYGQDLPEHTELMEGLNYNPVFPGGQLAMAQPLYGEDVEYEDGTEATLEQEAHDVAQFLMWAAEPKLNARKEAGFKAMIFLLILTFLTFLSYRRVWSDQH